MNLTARQRARILWQLTQPIGNRPCGCRFLLTHERTIERRVLACETHRAPYVPVPAKKRH